MTFSEVIVFDIDDTLYLERDFVRSGFQAVGMWLTSELGVQGLADTAWRLFESGVRRTTVTDAMQILGLRLDPVLVSSVVRVYREHEPEIHLEDDARRCLESMSRVATIGVVTDGPAKSQRAKFSALGLQRWISQPVMTAEMGTSKPDPAVFRRAAALVGSEAARYTYVADNPDKDFTGPLKLGWNTVRVRRPGSLHELQDTPAGIAEVISLDELGFPI